MGDAPSIQLGALLRGLTVVNGYNLVLAPTDSLRDTLGELAAERSRFSVAHEFAHVVLSHADDDHVGMGKAFELLRLADELLAPSRPNGFLKSVTAPDLALVSINRPDSSLLPGQTAVLLAAWRFKDWMIHDSAPTVPERVPSVRLSSMATRLVTDVRDFIEYLASLLADVTAAAIRRIAKLQATIRAELTRRAALLAWNPDVRAFVLVILAACRRYGRRSEPDDRAVPPMRRYPTSRGVACA